MYKPTKLMTIVLALQCAACVSVAPMKPLASIPEQLKPGANETLAIIVPASGVQVYECRASKDQGAVYEWAFVAPEAELFDTRGNKLGRHYAGPHWEANDGSKVAGTVSERAAAPVAGAIPWLLLSASSVGPQGTFSNVTSIQRVNTVGGSAPQNGCSQTALGTRARIGYSADYYLYTRR